MMKIIKVGNINRKEIKSLSDFYLKQIPRKLEVITVKDESIIDKMSLEGENILKHIKDRDFVITLEIKGKMIDSVEFSKLLNKVEVSGQRIVFIIGGSFGLSEDVMKRSDYKLSFSEFTFPHQLMFLILTEQIYRGYSIISGKQYHK